MTDLSLTLTTQVQSDRTPSVHGVDLVLDVLTQHKIRLPRVWVNEFHSDPSPYLPAVPLLCYLAGRYGLPLGTAVAVPSLHDSWRLAKFKVPQQVDITDMLPRTPSGKVLKRELRERLTQVPSAADTSR